jgi:excisionase family DNA binding protein
MSELSTDLGRQERRARRGTPAAPVGLTPLAVSPNEACHLLSIRLSRLYELMRTGELASYAEGRLRRIPMTAIHAYVERRTAKPNRWSQLTTAARTYKRGSKKRS